MEDTSASPEAQATLIFRRLLTRPPTEHELAAILAYQQDQQRRLARGELNAKTIVADDSATAEQAAWTLVARALMNLDETITRQ
jgi:hypothetical protein